MNMLCVRVVPIVALAALVAGTALLLHPSVPAIGAATLTGFDGSMLHGIEYGAHSAVFFAMTWLTLVVSPCHGSTRAAVITSVIAWALLSEYAQRWIPHRSVDPGDAACNLLGIAAAFWLVRKRPAQKTIAASSSESVAGAGSHRKH
jgi:hypothetical protein